MGFIIVSDIIHPSTPPPSVNQLCKRYNERTAPFPAMLHIGQTFRHNTPDEPHHDGRQYYPVALSEKARDHGLYVIGQTGTGKSTLLENMLLQDCESGAGFAVMEPNPDLTERVRHHIPKDRAESVVNIDLADLTHPIPFNPLAGFWKDEYRDVRHLVCSNIMAAFRKIWADQWSTTRMARVLRHTIMALLEAPQSNMLSIQMMLTDRAYRAEVVQNYVTDPVVYNFWTHQFEPRPQRAKEEIAEPILNRIEQLVTSPPIRNILCQKANTFDLADLMEQRGILLINLATGDVGEEAEFIGSLYLSHIYHTALRRDPRRTLAPFTCYIDEFADFATATFTKTLSQCRKYGLRFVLAHQYIKQMPLDVRASVFGNIPNFIMFRIGHEDTDVLDRYVKAERREPPLHELPNGHAYINVLDTPNCLIETYGRPEPAHGIADGIIQHSRDTYGVPREDVEQYIKDFYDDWYDGSDKKLPHIRIKA